MFTNSKAIGHTGDVISNRARHIRRSRANRTQRAAGLHDLRVVQVSDKQLAHHLLGALHGVQHLRVAVQRGHQKCLQGLIARAHVGAKNHQVGANAHGLRAVGPVRLQTRFGGCNQVKHLVAEHQANSLVQPAPRVVRLPQRGVRGQRLGGKVGNQGHGLRLRKRDQTGAHTIVNVVRVVSDLISQIAQLRLQGGTLAQQEPCAHAAPAVDIGGLALLNGGSVGARAMFQNALARLKAQVQPVKVGVALFQLVHHAQALKVVLKTAKVGHTGVQGVLPGMAKRCVAQVMGQGDGLHQVFV